MEGSSIVRANFRSILRHLASLPSANTPAALAKRQEIRSRFYIGATETDTTRAAKMREDALLYATLVNSISELKHLRELDTGDKLDPRQHINATASRVGFSLPSYSDVEQDFSGEFPQPKIVPSKFGKDVHFGQQPAQPNSNSSTA